jgi:hypothetical protein
MDSAAVAMVSAGLGDAAAVRIALAASDRRMNPRKLRLIPSDGLAVQEARDVQRRPTNPVIHPRLSGSQIFCSPV